MKKTDIETYRGREIKESPQTVNYISRYEDRKIEPTRKTTIIVSVPLALVLGVGLLVLFSRNAFDMGFLGGAAITVGIPFAMWAYMYFSAKVKFTESLLMACLVEALIFATRGNVNIMNTSMLLAYSFGNIAKTIIFILAALAFVYLFQKGKK